MKMEGYKIEYVVSYGGTLNGISNYEVMETFDTERDAQKYINKMTGVPYFPIGEQDE